MSEYIKVGDRIVVKPEGHDYSLTSGKVYDLKYDNFTGESYLKENGELNMPKKLYMVQRDTDFIKRCMTYFNSKNATQTTGVLLSGVKGSGKTILAKRLALESNLPIIIVDRSYPLHRMEGFFKNLKSAVCVLFDEFEKNNYAWPQTEILTFLDGLNCTAKKLVILTCNETKELDENLIDRASRIRYWRKYEIADNEPFVDELVKDKGIEDKNIGTFIKKHIELLSFDNINAFLEEYLLFKDTMSLKEILTSMNISMSNANEEDTKDEVEDENEIKDDVFVSVTGNR